MKSVLFALIGLVLGVVVGAPIGIGVGSVLADVLEVSCFEGGCGYFVVFIGLAGAFLGGLVGIVAGVYFYLRAVGRKRPPVTPA